MVAEATCSGGKKEQSDKEVIDGVTNLTAVGIDPRRSQSIATTLQVPDTALNILRNAGCSRKSIRPISRESIRISWGEKHMSDAGSV